MDQTIIDEVVRRVVEVARPERIILFSSAARGEMGPDSDIDLLVVKSGAPRRSHLEEEMYLSLFGLTVPVGVVVVTPEDIAQHLDTAGTISGPAFQEGREIYAA